MTSLHEYTNSFLVAAVKPPTPSERPIWYTFPGRAALFIDNDLGYQYAECLNLIMKSKKLKTAIPRGSPLH